MNVAPFIPIVVADSSVAFPVSDTQKLSAFLTGFGLMDNQFIAAGSVTGTLIRLCRFLNKLTDAFPVAS
jgi:hypothetical protein